MADAAGRSGSGNELQRNAKLMGTAPYGGGGERLCPGRTSGGDRSFDFLPTRRLRCAPRFCHCKQRTRRGCRCRNGRRRKRCNRSTRRGRLVAG